MVDLSVFATTAGPPRWKRPPDPPYPDAGLRRLEARFAVPATPPPPPTVEPASAEERELLTLVAEHLAAMSREAFQLDRVARQIARLELKLADPAIADQYPDGSDERDAGEERLRGLEIRWTDTMARFCSHACQVDGLLDRLPYEAAVAEVTGWGRDDAVVWVAGSHPNVQARRWFRIAVGLAVTQEKEAACPW